MAEYGAFLSLASIIVPKRKRHVVFSDMEFSILADLFKVGMVIA